MSKALVFSLLLGSIFLSSCGGSQDSNPVQAPSATDSETPEAKAAREISESLARKTTDIETQINSALVEILQPTKIQAEVALSELKLIDPTKDLAFENLDQLKTKITLKSENPSPLEGIQKLLDSDFKEMIGQISYDKDDGMVGAAVTKIDPFKMSKVYSSGLFQPTKVEQLLLPIRWMDPLKTKDPASYSYDQQSDQILATREIKDVATMTGTVNSSGITVSVSTKDVETLKAHPLFQAYGSIVIEYLKSLDTQKLRDSIKDFVRTISTNQ